MSSRYGELESTTEYDLDAVTEGIEAIYELFSLLQGTSELAKVLALCLPTA